MTGIFEQIEKEIYEKACKSARQMMKQILEDYDVKIMQERDKKKYAMVCKQRTAVKTIFGDVSFERRKYHLIYDGAAVEPVYLLDEALDIFGSGKYSHNLASVAAKMAAKMSFRQTSMAISRMTGENISHMAVWNIIQDIGQTVMENEEVAVKMMENDISIGKEKTGILFEEADGVYISIQGKDRKKSRKRKQEMKVGLAYKGCKDDNGKTVLIGKVSFAGFYTTDDFWERREAMLRRVYNLDEVKLRVLNSDGAAWIRNACDGDVIYQLDHFHIEQALTKKIGSGRVRNTIRKMLAHKDFENLFEYIEIYRNGLSGKAYDDANDFLTYLMNNKDGLLSYRDRNIPIPEPEEGMFYKNLGTLENHNFSIICQRMKHNRASWSISGANNMVKVLTEIENNTLDKTIQRMETSNFYDMSVTKFFAKKENSPLEKEHIDFNAGKSMIPAATHLVIEDSKWSFLRETIARINSINPI